MLNTSFSAPACLYHPLAFHLKFQKQFENEDNLICSLKMSLTIDQGHIYSSANIIFNSTH